MRIFERLFLVLFIGVMLSGVSLVRAEKLTIDKSVLLDKIKGGWAGQTIGCAFGGPTEFCYRGVMIPDSRVIEYPDGHLKYYFDHVPSLYDDIYMDLTFVDVFNRIGLDAPLEEFARAFAYAKYPLWHANLLGRYNIRNGVSPELSGHWKNNPHADCIDFQIEADFSGLMTPGMPNETAAICDRIGHMINYGDGWYGGVFVGAMYSFAFVENDVESIVRKALSLIPKESKFYACISDVLKWHEENPDDWKDCWTKYNKKWSKDVGCPELVLEAGNIDATMNSAYVVMGLLYGDGDFGKTMEVSCRCGQDSDCNPSTAAGVLATMMGYSNIPEKWMPNLREVEHINFVYTDMCLNRVYEVVYDLAVKEIVKNGGSQTESTVTIELQEPITVALEQSFPDMSPHELASKIENFGTEACSQNIFKFKGKGIVIHGEIVCNDKTYEAQLQAIVDGKPDKVMVLCSDYLKKTDAIYWNYDLDEGPHTISFKLLNPKDGVNIKANRVIFYTSVASDTLKTAQATVMEGYGDALGGGVSFDFDNDGLSDLFVTGATIKGHVLKGTGRVDNPYTEVSDIGDVGNVNYFAGVLPVDINNDGYVDLVAFDADPTGYTTNDKGKQGIFLGDGTGRFKHYVPKVLFPDGVSEQANFDWTQIKSADVADFNNDGLCDMVVCGGLGYSIFLINKGENQDGTLVFQKQMYDTSGKIRIKAKSRTICTGYVKAYDLNSDGYMDFVLFGPTVTGKAYYYINNPEKPGEFLMNEFPVYRELPSFDLADVNADGLPEIYYAGEFSSRDGGWLNRIFKPVITDGVLKYSLMFTLPWQNNDICMGYRSSVFVDWDGDGTIDIIETGRSDTEMPDGSNLDSRASKIRCNFGDGQSWDLPILTAGSNANSVILSDVNADGVVDYLRNGSNDLAVDVAGLSYGTGDIFSITINPNKGGDIPEKPILGVPVVRGSVVTLSWSSAIGSKGNETYEYAVFNADGKIVAGTNMVDYATGKRKAFTHGNACQAKAVALTLPKGKYVYKVQTVNGSFQGSAFAEGVFEIEDPDAVVSVEKSDGEKTERWFSPDGIASSPSQKGIFVSKSGKYLRR
ncbi:MAG: ADP-ribosylglycohydrolase family protein [Bacteroidaceae bacterium]|nr:ADP-ribosylglycohydrolase family protein [Bacteroidaceae bacterium]